jgi:hypothetical protein
VATRRLYAVEELKSNSIFFLLSHLVAVHLPELGIIQRLKYILDQITLSSSFQILAADPYFGCIFSTPQCQALRLVLTIRARHHLDVFNFPLSQKFFRLLTHDQTRRPRISARRRLPNGTSEQLTHSGDIEWYELSVLPLTFG